MWEFLRIRVHGLGLISGENHRCATASDLLHADEKRTDFTVQPQSIYHSAKYSGCKNETHNKVLKRKTAAGAAAVCSGTPVSSAARIMLSASRKSAMTSNGGSSSSINSLLAPRFGYTVVFRGSTNPRFISTIIKILCQVTALRRFVFPLSLPSPFAAKTAITNTTSLWHL